jgi:hypothetical protein
MHQDDFAIFAELNREQFDEILRTLEKHFKNIQSGRQGDDWIWIHLTDDDKIEIDSCFSMELEVKGKYKHLAVVTENLQHLDNSWIIQVFDPPKMDTTR